MFADAVSSWANPRASAADKLGSFKLAPYFFCFVDCDLHGNVWCLAIEWTARLNIGSNAGDKLDNAVVTLISRKDRNLPERTRGGEQFIERYCFCVFREWNDAHGRHLKWCCIRICTRGINLCRTLLPAFQMAENRRLLRLVKAQPESLQNGCAAFCRFIAFLDHFLD